MDTTSKFTESQMFIRKPAATVFNAMIDPEITTNFWFTKSSGKLEKGKAVTWKWEMYGVESKVEVVEIIPETQIKFDWGIHKRHVTFNFKPMEGGTYVTVRETGYSETGDELLSVIRDSTGGFTTVLDGMKAWLEHNINLNLIGDKFPSGK